MNPRHHVPMSQSLLVIAICLGMLLFLNYRKPYKNRVSLRWLLGYCVGIIVGLVMLIVERPARKRVAVTEDEWEESRLVMEFVTSDDTILSLTD